MDLIIFPIKITKIYFSLMLNYKLFFRCHGKIMSEHDTKLNALSADINFIFAERLVATTARRNAESCYFHTIFILHSNFIRK